MMQNQKLNLLSFKDNIRVLHLSWIAFFITFMVWFSHAPLLATLRDVFHLTDQEINALLILNVTLTIPARIIVGMLVDTYGPKRIYSLLLVIAGFLCFGFALADSFQQLALFRFLLGFVGAGFVIGIRMISEWFPAKQVGLAEGIYGGWGNFGSAAAAFSLPLLSLAFGGDNGWRYAIATTGVVALIYAAIYYFSVSDTPKGSTYFKPKKKGAMEVTSQGDLILYLIMNIPMYLALGLLTWKLGPTQLTMLSAWITYAIYFSLIGLYLFQSLRIYQINKHVLHSAVPQFERYKFKQVAVLNAAYFVTFGSELAVISMLPLFYMDTFGVTQVAAGILASTYAFMNLVSRPSGGLISDKFGRKRTLTLLITGLAIGYLVMSQIDSNWPVMIAVVVTITCATFGQSGSGAVFALVPLVKRRLTGQIAGMTGAYGSVGAVLFLTVLSFVSPQVFFLFIGCSAVIIAIAVGIFLEEPRGQMAEVLPDGTVQTIDLA